jgi:hypothetical protein
MCELGVCVSLWPNAVVATNNSNVGTRYLFIRCPPKVLRKFPNCNEVTPEVTVDVILGCFTVPIPPNGVVNGVGDYVWNID